MIQPIPGPKAYSDEWFALRMFDPDRRERPVIFGASDAAAAVDQSPYSSPLQLYLEKRGEFEAEFSEVQRRRMEEGHIFERATVDLYEIRTKQKTVRNLPMFFHPVLPFMAATPDGVAKENPETAEEICPDDTAVEAKLTSFRMIDKSGIDENKFGEAGTDAIPTQYLFQAQQQLAVLGLQRCDLPVYADEFRIYFIDRNDDLIEQIESAEKELAERIVAGDPPEPNWQHSGTVRVLGQMHGFEVGKVVTFDDEALKLWQRYQRLGELKKKIEEQRETAKAKLLHIFGPAELGRVPGVEDIEIKRSVIADSIFTEQDVREVKFRVGQLKRRGHVRLTQRKLKVAK